MAEIGIGAGFSANWNQQMLDQSVGNNNFVTTDGTVAPPYTQPVADSQPISMVNIPDNADLLAGIATELVPEILEAELYIHGIFEGIGNIFSPDGYQGAEDMGPNIMYSEDPLAGEKDTHVYLGMYDGEAIYVGITKNLQARQWQHGDKYLLEPITNEPVSRRQARAIEQVLIERNPSYNNAINSISPKRDWYDSAIQWGENWLNENGL